MTALVMAEVGIPTEQRNPRTVSLGAGSTLETLQLINREDALVAEAVARVLPALALVVDQSAARIGRGGRVHYFGAGTSGRIGVVDAVELVPTYGVAPDLVTAHYAGGPSALANAAEDVEDSDRDGRRDAATLEAHDVAFGITASGRTPYVLAALREARAHGAMIVLLSSNPLALGADVADHHLAVDTGPEALTGSTRLKAGTAAKLVLNSFSTALMVELGRTYSNLMVSLVPSNSKLRRRAITVLQEATGRTEADCQRSLTDSGGDVKVSLVAMLTDSSAATARQALRTSNGHVRHAVAVAHRPPDSAGRPGAVDPAADAATDRARHLVAVDVGGGGIRVRRTAVDGSSTQVATVGSGLSVGSAGLDLLALFADLDQAFEGAGVPREGAGVAAAAVGLSGFPDLVEDADDIVRRLRSRFPTAHVVLANDIVVAHLGALGGRAGVVLSVGTGAIALGTDLRTRWHRVDGAGHLLGDNGSGTWIGRQGLAAAVRAHDGRPGGSAALLDSAMAQFGSVGELVNSVHTSPVRAGLLASFAPQVLQLHPLDRVASEIVEAAAGLLAETAVAALHSPDSDEPIALTGGVVDGSHALRELIVARIGVLAPATTVVDSTGGPLDGAEVAARALVDGSWVGRGLQSSPLTHVSPVPGVAGSMSRVGP